MTTKATDRKLTPHATPDPEVSDRPRRGKDARACPPALLTAQVRPPFETPSAAMTSFFVTKYQDTVQDGGRDGLGLLPIWSRVARRCIWNVTSISRDLAGWRSLLVVAWLAEEVTGASDDAQTRRVMLAAERLIGLARRYAPDTALRDTRGLRGGSRLGQLQGPVHVSGDDRFLILKGQAATGVVGQIGRPAVRSGLLSESLCLDDDARARVAQALAELRPHRKRVRGWLLEGAPVDLAAPSSLLNPLARACSSAPADADEAAWLLDRVVFASRGVDPEGTWTPPRQQALARAILAEPALDNAPLSEVSLRLQSTLGADAATEVVGVWLRDIRALEALLGRMDDLFAWLRCTTKQARGRSWVVEQVQSQWGAHPEWLQAQRGDLDHGLRLVGELVDNNALQPFARFVRAVQDRDADAGIGALLDRNQAVVTGRDRRPWVSALGGSLRAELTTERGALKFGRQWEHTYYLAELRSLVRDCRPALALGGVA